MNRFEALAAEIDDALGNLANLDEVVNRATTASQLMEALGESVRRLRRVWQFVQDSQARGVSVAGLAPTDEAQLVQFLLGVAERLEEDPSAGIDSQSASDTRAAAERLTSTVRSRAEEAWSEYCTANEAPPVPMELINVFKELDAEATAHLEGYLSTCRMYSGADLPPAGGIRAYQEAVARIPTLLAGFGGESPEVKAFLEAVAVGGAPLPLLTEDVQTWLERGTTADGGTLADLFRVVLGRFRP